MLTVDLMADLYVQINKQNGIIFFPLYFIV